MKRSRAKMEGYLSITIRGYVFGAIAKCKASSSSKRDKQSALELHVQISRGDISFLCFGFHWAS